MEGRSLFLPTQQEWDGPEVGREGRKRRDRKLGHQEVEETNMGFLWRRGSLWSQDGNKRDQLWEEWPGLCDILGPQQADKGWSLETHSKEGKEVASLPSPHPNTSQLSPWLWLPSPLAMAAHRRPWMMPLPATSHGIILSSALLCDWLSFKSLFLSLSSRAE